MTSISGFRFLALSWRRENERVRRIEMNSQDILDNLDEYMAQADGPMFDNANLHFADARMSAFRSDIHWCLLFEIVWQDFRVSEPSVDICAYGNCLKEVGFLSEESDTPYFLM
jgi:hypothetical protein